MALLGRGGAGGCAAGGPPAILSSKAEGVGGASGRRRQSHTGYAPAGEGRGARAMAATAARLLKPSQRERPATLRLPSHAKASSRS